MLTSGSHASVTNEPRWRGGEAGVWAPIVGRTGEHVHGGVDRLERAQLTGLRLGS
jgi:hypothetical protein